MSNVPPELSKKVTLLKHFKTYMSSNLNKFAEGIQTNKTRDLDFLTKYVRSKQAVVFRLSNHNIQVIFN